MCHSCELDVNTESGRIVAHGDSPQHMGLRGCASPSQQCVAALHGAWEPTLVCPLFRRPFALNDLDDYEKHFTVMNYDPDVVLKQVGPGGAQEQV